MLATFVVDIAGDVDAAVGVTNVGFADGVEAAASIAVVAVVGDAADHILGLVVWTASILPAIACHVRT